MHRAIGILLAVMVVGGCTSITQDPIPTGSASTIAIFAPDSAEPCNSVLPFPSDLSRDPVTQRLRLPLCGPTANEPDDATALASKMGLNTLDGYSVLTAITADFSGPIDAATLATPGAIVVFNAFTGAQHAVSSSFDDVENVLTLRPTTPFAESTNYIVAITNALKAADGSEIVSDQAFIFMKSTRSLIDQFGYSRHTAIDDATATGLERLRLLWTATFEGLADASIAREDLLVAWSFTTQTVQASYPQLAGLVTTPPPFGMGGATVEYERTIAAADHLLLGAAGIPFNTLCKIHTGRITVQDLLTDAGTFGLDATGMPLVRQTAVDYSLITPNPTSVDCTAAGGNPDTWNFENIAIFGHTLGKCKNVALAWANAFGAANWAVLALDGPRAGGRSVLNLGDQDMDTCPDQITPEMVVVGTGSTNPFGVRDRMRQWGLELVQAAVIANATPWIFAGAAAPGTPPADIKVALVGHSWGGMAAILAGSVSTDVDVIAVSAAGGGMGTLFFSSIMGNFVLAGLTGTELAAATNSAALVFQWALDPADPIHTVVKYPPAVSLPVLAQVIKASSDGSMTEAPLHDATAQTALAGAFAAAGHPAVTETTFTLQCDGAAGKEPLCPDGTAAIGAPLKPCVANAVGLNKTTAIVGQIVTFVATFGAVVTGPDVDEACP